MSKRIKQSILLIMSLFVGTVICLSMLSTADARFMNYTRATPVKSRGTWYGHVPYLNYEKLVIRKHAVTWYQKDKRSESWKKTRHLQNKQLFVLHDKVKVNKHKEAIFGFYSAKQDDADFDYLATKRIKGKKVRVMKNVNGGTFYHSWKHVR
ncbi:hypothetical protein [Levilactobacillus angrenensis]|uniref:Uncharacterized protein n=1 Tax=Levilactobacillus angrenensis TaxID=2486020 RepID=A0ABW1U6N7_9LACO|nr:hypothetical protein [Levilactobacillus angrenensis]